MIVSHLRDRETCSSPGLIKNHFSIKHGMYSITKAMWFLLNTSGLAVESIPIARI